MSSELKFRTPEGIVFSHQLAGPVIRLFAWFLDWICVLLLLIALNKLMSLLSIVAPDLMSGLMAVAYFMLSIGYGIAFEWHWRGQTIGKRLLGLRVMDEEGLRLRFSQIAIRNLLRSVDMLPGVYLVGGVVCFFSRRSQRLGDFAANTIVVRNPRITEPDLDQLALGKFNSLRRYPHLEARLRQRISPEEAQLALQSLLRRDEFEPAARVELFGGLADHFKAIVIFPAEAVESVADEQYVRNVVDILFRNGASKRNEGGGRGETRLSTH